jgi:hypothetical protein
VNTYHGTSPAQANQIAQGNVDVSLGGGELGQGFYSQTNLYEAKQWAFHRFGGRQANVVEFAHDDNDIENLNYQLLGTGGASLLRQKIKALGATRTYKFFVDMVWSPIVGSERIHGDQLKWESDKSAQLLNGTKTPKGII